VADWSIVSTPTTAVTYRPRKARKAAVIAAVAVVVLFTVVSFGLTGSTGQGRAVFQRGDQAAMIGLGLAFAAGFLLFLRPKVSADGRGVRVQNVIGSYDLPWEVVRGVRFERGASFASLELEDDELVTVVALQLVDGEHALAGVRALRDLHERARQG
jgi:Bacterial PH domain